jgi:hypothetical protein
VVRLSEGMARGIRGREPPRASPCKAMDEYFIYWVSESMFENGVIMG